MPKRKSDNCDRIKRKIRKLEKKLLRRKRRRSYSSDDSELEISSLSSPRSPLYDQEDEIMEYNEEMPDIIGTPSGGDLSQPELDRNPIPSTSHNTSIPSVVIVAPSQNDPPQTTASQPVQPTGSTETPVQEGLEFDSEILQILGMDPTTDKKYGQAIQNDLAVRFQHWTTSGLTNELRKELMEKYLTPENCKLIDPPELNAEIKAAVSDIITKRDKAIHSKQKRMTSAITCLGEAITSLLSSKEKNTVLLKLLMDSARIICDCQHADSMTRRNFLLCSVNKDVRDQVQNTKIDKLLFGENLAETLKSAKAINRSGTDLKAPVSKPQDKRLRQNISGSSRNLNWKGQGPVRRLTGPPKTKEPAVNSTGNRIANSSMQSQRPPQKHNYNRR